MSRATTGSRDNGGVFDGLVLGAMLLLSLRPASARSALDSPL